MAGSKHMNSLIQLLQEAGGPLSADEIRECLGRRSIGQATIYRLLKQGVENSQINELSFPNSPNRFEISGLKHHHHFICDECDRVYDIEGCFKQVSDLAPKGFKVNDHDILLRGQCDQCVGVSA